MKLLNLKELQEKIKLSRSSIYKLIKDGKFPKPINLNQRRVSWIEKEIDDWISNKMKNRTT